MPYPMIKSIMQRRTKGITLKTVFLIARACGVTITEFFGGESFSYENLDLE